MQRAPLFVRETVKVLAPLADAEKAAGMTAYMRGQFTYLGITTPERRAAINPLIRAFKPETAAELRAAVDALWKKREREYQYVAVDLLARRHAVLSAADTPWLLDLAQQKSWWDTVDALAKTVGAVVRRSGAQGARQMDRAVRHADLWVRRVAMIHQLGWRAQTDTTRLFDYARLLAPETGVLHPQGHRLGPARLRLARLERHRAVSSCGGQPVLRSHPARGREKHSRSAFASDPQDRLTQQPASVIFSLHGKGG